MIVDGIDWMNILWALFFTPSGWRYTRDEDDKMTRVRDWGLRAILWGFPGVAKTALISAFARRIIGGYYFPLKPGARGDGAFGVIPVPRTVNGYEVLIYPLPDWMVEFMRREVGLLFLDETNTLPTLRQAPLLGALQDKEIGSGQLPPRVRVIGACNEVEDGAGAHPLAMSAANRVFHFKWPIPPEEHWSAGLLTEFDTPDTMEPIDALKEETRVLKYFPDFWARASGLMAGFTNKRRLHFEKLDPNKPDEAARRGKAWTSPRSKTAATYALAGAYAHDLSEAETHLMIEASCGEAFALEFAKYSRSLDLVDPREFLEGKARFRHDPARLDRTAVFINSCAAVIAPLTCPDRMKLVKAFYAFTETVVDDVGDVIAGVTSDVLITAKLTGLPEAQTTIAKIAPMIRATDKRRRVKAGV